MKGDTGAHMIGLLERRLDAVVYRAKFVPTVFAARQFVSHGHVKVNGRRVTIASYRVKVGDLIEVKEKSKQLALVHRGDRPRRARRAGLHRGRSHQDDGQACPHSAPDRCALPGPDGAASGGRVLLALIQTVIARFRRAIGFHNGALLGVRVGLSHCASLAPTRVTGCSACAGHDAPRMLNSRRGAFSHRDAFVFIRSCSSPAWNISRMMSQPPTNSPLT